MKTGKPRTEDRRRRERLARREKRAGDMLPYARHIDATTIATRDGQQMQVIHVAGFSFETADTQELNYRKNIRDTLLRGIASSRLSIGAYIVRHMVRPGLEGQVRQFVLAQCRRRLARAAFGPPPVRQRPLHHPHPQAGAGASGSLQLRAEKAVGCGEPRARPPRARCGDRQPARRDAALRRAPARHIRDPGRRVLRTSGIPRLPLRRRTAPRAARKGARRLHRPARQLRPRCAGVFRQRALAAHARLDGVDQGVSAAHLRRPARYAVAHAARDGHHAELLVRRSPACAQPHEPCPAPDARRGRRGAVAAPRPGAGEGRCRRRPRRVRRAPFHDHGPRARLRTPGQCRRRRSGRADRDRHHRRARGSGAGAELLGAVPRQQPVHSAQVAGLVGELRGPGLLPQPSGRPRQRQSLGPGGHGAGDDRRLALLFQLPQGRPRQLPGHRPVRLRQDGRAQLPARAGGAVPAQGRLLRQGPRRGNLPARHRRPLRPDPPRRAHRLQPAAASRHADQPPLPSAMDGQAGHVERRGAVRRGHGDDLRRGQRQLRPDGRISAACAISANCSWAAAGRRPAISPRASVRGSARATAPGCSTTRTTIST